MEEYKNYEMTRRFNKKRKKAIDDFWREEAKRIMNNTPTRLWTEEQKKDILSGRKPKFNGRPIQGHHTFSASKFPHLAGDHRVIYPATFIEHLVAWHGGNWKTSLPGKRMQNSNAV